MKKLLFIIFFISYSIVAKNRLIKLEGYDFYPKQELVDKYNPQNSIWIPILETIGFNVMLGGYNKYVTNSEFAQINFNTIKSNFKYGWGWDADNFHTNMWSHPFQGSIYFNTARSNGYNYWVSLLITTFGSLHWEYFMETEHPAINDLVITSLQGAKGKELVNLFEPSIIFNLDTRVKLGIEYLLYYRDGKYENFPNMYLDDKELRAFLSIGF